MELHLKLYQDISPKKKTSEKFIGKTTFSWKFSEVFYTADCTIGIPFDLFDKTIVGLLQIDGSSSITEMGEILGMNLIDDPENQQFKDDAEYDLLRLALDSLYDFKMIEIGDMDYTACRLTELGKEYAQHGRKFTMEEGKSFSLFFDEISESHIDAKRLFEEHKVKGTGLSSNASLLDDELMKEIALEQAPEIYNPEVGNSFVNARVNNRKSKSYEVELELAIVFDVLVNDVRFLVFNPENSKGYKMAEEWLNENHKDELLRNRPVQLRRLARTTTQTLPEDYIQQLAQKSKELDTDLEEGGKNVFSIAQEVNESLGFVEVEYLWNNLESFMRTSPKELFFFIPSPSSMQFELIAGFAKKDINLFLIVQESHDLAIKGIITNLIEQSEKRQSNFYILVLPKLSLASIWLIGAENKVFNLNSFGVSYEETKLPFTCFELEKGNVFSKQYEAVKTEFAATYLAQIITAIESTEVNPKELSKSWIKELETIDQKASPFSALEDVEVVRLLSELQSKKADLIATSKIIHEDSLLRSLDEIKSSLESSKIQHEKSLSLFRDGMEKLKQASYSEYGRFSEGVINFEKQLDDISKLLKKKQKKEIKSTNENYKNMIKQLQPNEKGLYVIGSFISLLKRNNPKFDYKKKGFKKASQFVGSLKGFTIIKNQYFTYKD